MELSFRWFGSSDPIPLQYIRQIPGVRGVVSALYDVPVGSAWPRSGLEALAAESDAAGLKLSVIESVPVHEDIKLGRASRVGLTDNYCASIEAMGAVGVPVLCYNFMPVFDWMRTELARRLPDGSTALAYDDAALQTIDLSQGTADLPGWATGYSAEEMVALRAAYAKLTAEQLWENLAWFLERIVPVAEASGVRLALHPDDPPWPILGLPRIIGNGVALERVLGLVDSPANGLTFCSGSLAASPENDVPALARSLGERGRIHFAHCRNVKVTGPHRFEETPHPSACGDVDQKAVLQALFDTGFTVAKFFPAAQAGGVEALKALGGPFPTMRFCPTGGVDAQSALSYLALPNVICVGGSWIAPRAAIAAGDFGKIEQLAKAAAALRAARPLQRVG